MTDGQPGSFYKKVNNMGAGKTNNSGPGGDASPQEKRKTLTALLLALGILQTLYMNLAAFFPLFARENYKWVKGTQVGVVLA
jgi:hypothetical protein